MRNEKECVCSAPNILISGNIIKEMPGWVASGTPYRTDVSSSPGRFTVCRMCKERYLVYVTEHLSCIIL